MKKSSFGAEIRCQKVPNFATIESMMDRRPAPSLDSCL